MVRLEAGSYRHDARWQGLYGASAADVKRAKGLHEKDNLFDHAGPLELSAHEFQMNLAADVIAREQIRGEQAAIGRNKEVSVHVRGVMQAAGSVMPEQLPLEPEPIAKVKQRLAPPAAKPPKKVAARSKAKKSSSGT